LNPLFQLSTRSYEKEIAIVMEALSDLEKECGVIGGVAVEEPFSRFGWTFFNMQISEEMAEVIEKSGMMEGAAGHRIGEQLTNFVGHYLDTRGSNVRIKKIDYG